MRHIGNLGERDHAHRLVDHLLTLGIEARADDDDGGWAIWVLDDEHVEAATHELDVFSQQPDDSRYRASASLGAAARAQAEEEERAAAALRHDARERWRSTSAVGVNRPVTYFLLTISLAVFLTSDYGTNVNTIVQKMLMAELVQEGSRVSWWPGLREIRSGELWRLVTPIFVHFDGLHLLFNMFFTLLLGTQIEQHRGKARFAALVLIAAVFSNCAQVIVSGPYFGGMSGVVYALFGYVWMKMRYDPATPLFINPGLLAMGLVALLLGFTGMLGNIANMAHLGGLVAGCAIGARQEILLAIQDRLDL